MHRSTSPTNLSFRYGSSLISWTGAKKARDSIITSRDHLEFRVARIAGSLSLSLSVQKIRPFCTNYTCTHGSPFSSSVLDFLHFPPSGDVAARRDLFLVAPRRKTRRIDRDAARFEAFSTGSRILGESPAHGQTISIHMRRFLHEPASSDRESCCSSLDQSPASSLSLSLYLVTELSKSTAVAF